MEVLFVAVILSWNTCLTDIGLISYTLYLHFLYWIWWILAGLSP